MYESCVNCHKIGLSCDGPNFVAMSASELVSWCKSRKSHLGLSNQRLAELANVSKGTVDGFLASAHADFRYETIRPILKALVGGNWSGEPCPDPTSDERAHYEEKIQQLEAGITWRDDKIKHLTNNYESMTTLITNTNKRHEETKKSYEEELAFLRKEIKRKNKFVTTLAIIAIVALLYIIVMLIIDRLDPTKGYYWLESLMKPHGITDILHKWST